MAPIRWGIASAGKISNDFCAALSSLPKSDHTVVSVAARNETSAKEFSKLFDIPKYYGGYEKLAADLDVGTLVSRSQPSVDEILNCKLLRHS